jgi:hypothetical protein
LSKRNERKLITLRDLLESQHNTLISNPSLEEARDCRVSIKRLTHSINRLEGKATG